MKKFAVILLAALLLSGCGNNEVQPEISETSQTETTTAVSETRAVTTTAEKATTTAITTTVTTETTTAAEPEPKLPEPILPQGAVKIDIDGDFGGKKYDFDYRVLDEENMLILYTFKNDDRVSAQAKIFGISDGGEKVHIDIPVTEADTFFVRDRAYSDDENILCQIYGCRWDEDMYIETSRTTVNNDLSYGTDTSGHVGFWDYGYRSLPSGRRIMKTEYGNIYEVTEDNSWVGRKVLLNAVFDGWYNKGNVYYHYDFSIDENRFVYSMSGWEWIWGIGVYDFASGEARDIPDTGDFFPIGFHGGKIYSVCSGDGYTEKVIYGSDINTLETKPLFELDENDNADTYKMTPDGKLLIKGNSDANFKVTLYDPDTLGFLREYEFENVYTDWWEMDIISNDKAVLTDDKQKCLYVLDFGE